MSIKTVTSFLREAQVVLADLPEKHPYREATSSLRNFSNFFKDFNLRFISKTPSRYQIKDVIIKNVKETAIAKRLLGILDKNVPKNLLALEQDLIASKNSFKEESLFSKDCGEDGSTALHTLCFFGLTNRSVSIPKEHHDLLCITNSDLDTPLHLLARSGNVSLFKTLYKDFSLPFTISTKKNLLGRTPFQEACAHGHFEMAQELFDLHSDPSVKIANLTRRDANGNTPLHYCAENRYTELGEFLLSSSVALDRDLILIKNNDEEIPFHLACQFGSVRLAKRMLEMSTPKTLFLSENSEKQLPIHLACDQFQFEVLQLLLKNKDFRLRQITAQDSTLETPLNISARRNFYGGINYMLSLLSEEEQNQVVDMVDIDGHTALHDAAGSGSLAAVEMLMLGDDAAKFRRTTRENNYFNSPIDLAGPLDNLSLLDALLFEDLDLRFKQLSNPNANAQTAFHVFCVHLSVDHFKYVTRGFSDFQIISLLTKLDELEKTPLHCAVKNIALFVFLFECYPDLIRNKYTEDMQSPMGLYLELYGEEIRETYQKRKKQIKKSV